MWVTEETPKYVVNAQGREGPKGGVIKKHRFFSVNTQICIDLTLLFSLGWWFWRGISCLPLPQPSARARERTSQPGWLACFNAQVPCCYFSTSPQWIPMPICPSVRACVRCSHHPPLQRACMLRCFAWHNRKKEVLNPGIRSHQIWGSACFFVCCLVRYAGAKKNNSKGLSRKT